jgi:indole-3-glycerol phosphate synthase
MILDELAAYASFRVAEAKKKIAADELERKARSLPKGDFRFEHALCNTGVSFICEVKRASPSFRCAATSSTGKFTHTPTAGISDRNFSRKTFICSHVTYRWLGG